MPGILQTHLSRGIAHTHSVPRLITRVARASNLLGFTVHLQAEVAELAAVKHLMLLLVDLLGAWRLFYGRRQPTDGSNLTSFTRVVLPAAQRLVLIDYFLRYQEPAARAGLVAYAHDSSAYWDRIDGLQ